MSTFCNFHRFRFQKTDHVLTVCILLRSDDLHNDIRVIRLAIHIKARPQRVKAVDLCAVLPVSPTLHPYTVVKSLLQIVYQNQPLQREPLVLFRIQHLAKTLTGDLCIVSFSILGHIRGNQICWFVRSDTKTPSRWYWLRYCRYSGSLSGS